MAGFLEQFGGLIGSAVTNKQNQKAAARARQQQYDTIEKLDWEPMYASQNTPQYQKTQSPVARAYLESMLLGANPDAVASTRPNAAVQKGIRQTQQNALYGTPAQRVAEQSRIASTNPYTVRTPTREVMGAQAKEAVYSGRAPNAAGTGLDAATYQKLIESGALKEGEDLKFDASGQYGRALTRALEAGDMEAVEDLVNPQVLDRKWAMTKRRQKRKRGRHIRDLVNKYGAEEEG